ncbi:MAG TPA: sulfatase-like hydrolase/transferase, partial [Vicinamibacterales bacterium]
MMIPPRALRGRALGWVTLAVVLAAAAGAALLWWPRAGRFALEPAADRNILLVTIDTLRADALSSYGGPASTPNLDRLAAAGARFTFAHAHAVVTLPSHTSILTGRLPYEHGMRDNSGFRVKEGTGTLATWLKSAGFATGAFVGGFPVTKRFGLAPGFDVYDDQMPELT